MSPPLHPELRRRLALTAAGGLAPMAANGSLINLIPDGEFDLSPLPLGMAIPMDVHPDWTYSGDRSFLAGAGTDRVPMFGADGGFTGNFAILGEILEVDFQVPAVPGMSNIPATLDFEAIRKEPAGGGNSRWSLENLSQGNQQEVTFVSVRSGWTHFSYSLSLVPGDEYLLRFRQYATSSRRQLALDGISLEINLPEGALPMAVSVPEPTPAGLTMLGGFFAWILRRKTKSNSVEGEQP